MYRSQPLPSPERRAYHLGQEYGNPGLCNPAHFLVGNLIRHLRRLEKEDAPRQRRTVKSFMLDITPM